MTANFALTPDQVKRAVDTVIQNNPAYADILGFYGRLFDAQEECKSRLQIEPLQIPDDVLAVKAQKKFPLIEIKEFVFDEVESARLFYTIGKLAKVPVTRWHLGLAGTFLPDGLGFFAIPYFVKHAFLIDITI